MTAKGNMAKIMGTRFSFIPEHNVSLMAKAGFTFDSHRSGACRFEFLDANRPHACSRAAGNLGFLLGYGYVTPGNLSSNLQ